MAYYDENGKITIDEAAANADIRRIETALAQLENSKNALNALLRQASEGQGQTTNAVVEKSAQLIDKVNDMMQRLNETISFIRQTVAHYEEVDRQLKEAILAEGDISNG